MSTTLPREGRGQTCPANPADMATPEGQEGQGPCRGLRLWARVPAGLMEVRLWRHSSSPVLWTCIEHPDPPFSAIPGGTCL